MPLPGQFDDWKKKETDDPGALPQSGTTNSALVISAVSSGTPSGGNATVTWTTSQGGSSRVSYGAAPNASQLTTAETDTSPLVTSHSVTLSNLTAGQQYLFTVHSRLGGGKDGMNNVVMDGYDFQSSGSFLAA